jgi:hypothetical protein
LSSDQRAPYWAADSESSFCIVPAMGEPGDAEAPNSVFSSRNDLQRSSKSELRFSAAVAGPANRAAAAAMVAIRRRMARQRVRAVSLTWQRACLKEERSELGGAAARPLSVQHPDPDPPQQSHRHHRQRQHSKALKLF